MFSSREARLTATGAFALLSSLATFTASQLQERKGFEDSKAFLIASTLIVLVAGAASFEFLRIYKLKNSKKILMIYSHLDRSAAIDIANLLKKNGYEPWLSTEAVLPGQNIRGALKKALEESSVALALVSENFSKSSEANENLSDALRYLVSEQIDGISVVPVRLDASSLPSELDGIQAADLNESEGLDRLMAGLAAATRRKVN